MNHQRTFRLFAFPLVLGLLFAVSNRPLTAQPSAAALADQLEQAYTDRLQNINRLRISTVTTGGMLQGMESTVSYEKVVRDGREVLVEVDEDGAYGGMFEGLFDDALPDMIRNSSSIANDRFEEFGVYRIVVDDPKYLQSLESGESFVEEELDGEFRMESATILIDSRELLPRYVTFEQTGQGGEILTIHFTLSDYRNHSGFPVPHRMNFHVEGIEQMISDEDMAQARAAMQEMESQLAEMPEAQRRMIEDQLRPQMEQFEAMLEQDDLGRAEIEVTEVVVN